jgi:hypothetical protein
LDGEVVSLNVFLQIHQTTTCGDDKGEEDCLKTCLVTVLGRGLLVRVARHTTSSFASTSLLEKPEIRNRDDNEFNFYAIIPFFLLIMETPANDDPNSACMFTFLLLFMAKAAPAGRHSLGRKRLV